MIDAPIEGLSTVRYVYTPRISAARWVPPLTGGPRLKTVLTPS